MLPQYICVDYPGYVKNDTEAIRSLGGMERIEQTFQRRNRKLFLNFTPDNLFSKMLCSNIIESTTHSNHTHQNQPAEDPETPSEFENRVDVSWTCVCILKLEFDTKKYQI